ncbi:MAG TPA: hypothetical protein VHZ24_12035 [Pirellulales bacterium]|jgi:hypothetical protein|nr:hypothetical protein [Pirellulales bacterium]
MSTVKPNPTQPISVKQAVQSATKFLKEVLGEDLPGLRLEEVEMTEDEQSWMITLSFFRGAGEGLGNAAFSSPFQDREYKQVEVAADTGVARAMRIRAV